MVGFTGDLSIPGVISMIYTFNIWILIYVYDTLL